VRELRNLLAMLHDILVYAGVHKAPALYKFHPA